MVQIVNAITLSGGGAYGLAAASGVMRCLEARASAFRSAAATSSPSSRPRCRSTPGSAEWACHDPFPAGLQACLNAASGPVQQGDVGAGAGAVSGGVRGGIGTASVVLDNGMIVGAIVAVNSQGSAFTPEGDLYASALALPNEFDTVLSGKTLKGTKVNLVRTDGILRSGTNAVVATNVQLTKAQAIKIAEMADDRPGPGAHTDPQSVRQRHGVRGRHRAHHDAVARRPGSGAASDRRRGSERARARGHVRPRVGRVDGVPPELLRHLYQGLPEEAQAEIARRQP